MDRLHGDEQGVLPARGGRLLAALRTGVVLDRRRVTPQALRQAVTDVLADEDLPARWRAIGDSFRAADEMVRAALRTR